MTDFDDAFLRANANKDFICSEFTEVLRDLTRALAVVNEPHSAIHRATKKKNFVMELAEHCDEPISFYVLFSEAVRRLRNIESNDRIDWRILRAVQAGMSLYAESSCVNNAAKGRISQRETRFFDAIRWMNEAREAR